MVTSTCSNVALASVLSIAKKIIFLIQLFVPLILIISGTIGFIKLTSNPEDKKGMKSLINRFLAAIVVFFVPVLMNATMGLLGETTTFSNCWNQASDTISFGHTYVSDGDEDNSSIISNGQDYEHGVPNSSESSNPNNGGSGGNSSTGGSDSNGTSGSVPSSSGKKVVFIGDSRTVQMYAYLTGNWSSPNYSSGGVHTVGNDIFIAQGSMGLDWLKSTGIPVGKSYFSSGTSVVILMGVNDLHNIDQYISYLNQNIASWKKTGSQFYYVSVNPCTGSYNSMNSKIANFNSKLQRNLSSSFHWIDTYSYLSSSGYSTTDGLHYDNETSNKIYNYIKNNV